MAARAMRGILPATLAMGSNLTISTGNTTIDAAVRDDCDGEPDCCDGGDAERDVARVRAARAERRRAEARAERCLRTRARAAMVQVGDPTYAMDTPGFHMDNVVINTTAATSATAKGLAAYRTQEMDLESLYFLGNANQTGMTLDGTGNYTGGTFYDNAVQRIPDGGECDRAPGCESGDDGLDECEHVCAAAHRLPDERRKSDCGDLRNQPAAGRRKHIYGRRCGRLLDGAAPGSECAEQHDCWACGTRTRRTRWWRTRAALTTTG